jgi:biopolymer transport protein ExbD
MDERGFEGINVIPFIDIMLVLLTIVLTTATFIANGTIPVHLPKAQNSTTDGRGLTVTIDRDGKIFFRESEVSSEDLRTALFRENRQTPLLIRADKAVALQSFVNVLDMVKGLGFTKMSLQTEVSQ